MKDFEWEVEDGEIHISIDEGEFEAEKTSRDSATRDDAAIPTRLAFCTSWTFNEKVLEIEDELEEIVTDQIPLEVSATNCLFLATFWTGFATGEKPRLTIETPNAESLAIRLPALKRYVSQQVQVTALNGFSFAQRGGFRFGVSGGGRYLEKTLTVS